MIFCFGSADQTQEEIIDASIENKTKFFVEGQITKIPTYGQTQAAVQYMGRTYPDIYSGPFRSESWDIEIILINYVPISDSRNPLPIPELGTVSRRFTDDEVRLFEAGLKLAQNEQGKYHAYSRQTPYTL